MRILKFFGGVFTMFILACGGAWQGDAAESGWVTADHVQARLIGAGEEAMLQMRLTEGWHTYWRVPGDSGLPPRFDWEGSKNVADVALEWPVPKRFEEFGLQIFGYEGEVSFPLKLVREETGQDAKVALKTDVMVCKDICIPQVLELGLDIPAGEENAGARKLIEFARRKVPADGDSAALKIDTVVAGPDGLVLSVFAQKKFSRADLFVTVEGRGLTSEPEIAVDENEARKALIKIATPEDIENLQDFLAGKELRIVFAVGNEAIEKVIGF